MVLALAAIQENDKARFKKFLGLTILGGADVSWVPGLRVDASASAIPLPEHQYLIFSKDLFATTFFVLTGFHGMHVTGGVIYNTSVLAAVNRGRYQAKHVEIAGLYWHFVDLGLDTDFHFCLSHSSRRFEETAMSSTTHSTRQLSSRFSISSWRSPIIEVALVYLGPAETAAGGACW